MGCIAVVSERPSSLTFLSLWSFDHYNFFSFLSFWNVRLLIEDSFFLSFSFQSRFGNSSNCTIAHVGRRGYENMSIQKRKRFPRFLGQAIFHLKDFWKYPSHQCKISLLSVLNSWNVSYLAKVSLLTFIANQTPLKRVEKFSLWNSISLFWRNIDFKVASIVGSSKCNVSML